MWIDLVRSGRDFRLVTWFPKLNLDPAIEANYPRGWQDVDYVISTQILRTVSSDPRLPDVHAALENSTAVASFRRDELEIAVRFVNPVSQSLRHVQQYGIGWGGQSFESIGEFQTWLRQHGFPWRKFQRLYPRAAALVVHLDTSYNSGSWLGPNGRRG
jgi:hypothetical protein